MKITLLVELVFDKNDSNLDIHVAIADVARTLDTATVSEPDTTHAVVSVEYETLNDLLDLLRGDQWTESGQTLGPYPPDLPTGPV